MSGEPSDFDRELETELHRVLDPMVAGSIPLRDVPARSGFLVKLLGGAGAALAAKTVTGVAIAALAAGAATEAVITHSLNPADWARQIPQTLQVVETGHSQQGNSHSSTASPAASTATATATAQPSGNGLPVHLPTVTPPPSLPVAVPSVSPIPSHSCGPISNEIGTGCK